MTREEYIKLFHKAQLNLVAFKMVNDCDAEILALVNAAIEEEREACAKVCEPQEIHDDPLTAFNIAAAIRARGLTSLRRQLIDAGALQSDPAGLKARGQV